MAITPAQISAINTATFTSAEDIDDWSQSTLGGHFFTWFNTNFAKKGVWDQVAVVDTPQNRLGFHAFWNDVEDLTGSTATPFQFLCLMSIFANECAANF